jgi:hypothetical protein
MRLSTMIVLLAVVLVLIFATNRPEIWSQLVPNLDQPTPSPTHTAPRTAKTAPTQPSFIQASRPMSRQSPLLLAGLLIVAMVYFVWRITRAVSRCVQSKQLRAARPVPNPQDEE